MKFTKVNKQILPLEKCRKALKNHSFPRLFTQYKLITQKLQEVNDLAKK